MQPIIATEQI